MLVLLGGYRKKMNTKDKEFYDIVLNNCTEEEIYAILLKKKEIDDKIPKLRTEDETRTLRSLYNKMRKFPKDLIAEMKNKFPSLQRKPKTAEQRKEQNKEHQSQKRSAESEIERERRLTQKKEYDSRKRAAESEIEQEMRVKKQKEFELQRYTQSPQFRAKKVQEVREKRSEESEIEKEMSLKKKKSMSMKNVLQRVKKKKK